MNHKKYLDEPFFSQIANGEKSSELNIQKSIFAGLNLGDSLTFFNDNDNEMTVVIENIRRYDNFETALKTELNNLLPGYDYKTGLNLYKTYYPNKSDEDKYGVIIIDFKKL